MRRKNLKIVGQVDYVDLRKITAQSRFLYRMMNKYDLKLLECICFTNNARTRFRLVINLDGIPHLDIPAIDEKGKYSLYLKISEHFSRLAALSSTRVQLTNLASKTTDRIKRSEARKKAKQNKNSKKRRKRR